MRAHCSGHHLGAETDAEGWPACRDARTDKSEFFCEEWIGPGFVYAHWAAEENEKPRCVRIE